MPFRRSATRRAFSARRWAKKRRRLIRGYNRRKTLRKTRRTVKRDKVERTKVLASFKWNESRIMRHVGYAGYDRCSATETSGMTMEQGLQAPLTLFDRSGESVAAHGDQYLKYDSNGTQNADWERNKALLLGKNFLDTKYPFGRPMNEWTFRPNHCFLPDVHGTIGKTYWALHEGCHVDQHDREDGSTISEHDQVLLRPQPVVHRPFMIDRFAREYEKFCVLGVTYDISVQALPYDTNTYGDPVIPPDSDLWGKTYRNDTVDGETTTVETTIKTLLEPVADYDQSDLLKADIPSLVNRISPSGMRATGVRLDKSISQTWGYPLWEKGDLAYDSTTGTFSGNLKANPNIELGTDYIDIFLKNGDESFITAGRIFSMPDPRAQSYAGVPQVTSTLKQNWYGRGTPLFFKIDKLRLGRRMCIRCKHAYYSQSELHKAHEDGGFYNFYAEVYSALMLLVTNPSNYSFDLTVAPGGTSSGVAAYHEVPWENVAHIVTHMTDVDDIPKYLMDQDFMHPSSRGFKSSLTFFDFKFTSAIKGGTMPAQSDAYKGPGYFVARVTNQNKLDDPEFQNGCWDINRLLENRKRSCKIKYIRHDDKRVKKLRVSWTLQQQKKFRPKGFSKKRFKVPDHHHDIVPNTINSLWANTMVPGTALDQLTEVNASDVTATTGPNNPGQPYHSHQVPVASTTTGPHSTDIIDLRAKPEITSDDYSLRGIAGEPLNINEKHYDYINPAVGEIDLMMNRDFPKDEQPRLFLQYLRPHTDDPFDDHKGILQPPPVRVKVTARYRVAFFKTPPEKDLGNQYGGESDAMDHDGATDPLIKKNPCPAYVYQPETDTTAASLMKQTEQYGAASYPGDGLYSDGSKVETEDKILKLKMELSSVMSKGKIRLFKLGQGNLTITTDKGIILNPLMCFPPVTDIKDHPLYQAMDPWSQAAIDRMIVDANNGDAAAAKRIDSLMRLFNNPYSHAREPVDDDVEPPSQAEMEDVIKDQYKKIAEEQKDQTSATGDDAPQKFSKEEPGVINLRGAITQDKWNPPGSAEATAGDRIVRTVGLFALAGFGSVAGGVAGRSILSRLGVGVAAGGSLSSVGVVS